MTSLIVVNRSFFKDKLKEIDCNYVKKEMHGLVMCDASQIFRELIYTIHFLSLFSQSILEILG